MPVPFRFRGQWKKWDKKYRFRKESPTVEETVVNEHVGIPYYGRNLFEMLWKRKIVGQKVYNKLKLLDNLPEAKKYTYSQWVEQLNETLDEETLNELRGLGAGWKRGLKQAWAERTTPLHAGWQGFKSGFEDAFFIPNIKYALTTPFRKSFDPEEFKSMNIITKKLLTYMGYKEGKEFTLGQKTMTTLTGGLFGKSVMKTGLSAFVFGSELYRNIHEKKLDTKYALMKTGMDVGINFVMFESVQSAATAALGLGAVGAPVGIAALPMVIAVGATMLAGGLLEPGIERYFEMYSHSEEKYRQLRKRGFNMGIVDTRMAATMRQQSLNAIQKSHMSARQFVLGNEATILERSL